MLGMQHSAQKDSCERRCTVQCGSTYHYVKRTMPYVQVSGHGGVSRIRTDGLLLAKQVLYQLSYNPA